MKRQILLENGNPDEPHSKWIFKFTMKIHKAQNEEIKFCLELWHYQTQPYYIIEFPMRKLNYLPYFGS